MPVIADNECPTKLVEHRSALFVVTTPGIVDQVKKHEFFGV
jgi:hypothetical protein